MGDLMQEMRTTIRATCSHCKTQLVLAPRQVVLRTCLTDMTNSYRFDCPECLQTVVKEANSWVCSILLGNGVVWESWAVPAEVLERAADPPLSPDDLLDLLAMFDDPEWDPS